MKHLIIEFTTSRAKDTYGYNIVTLWDARDRFKATGGGYDMLGTVFGDWLQRNYIDKIKSLLKPHGIDGEKANYGLIKLENGHCYLDGSCGLECMIAIAKKIGLKVTVLYDRKRINTTGFVVEEL